MTHNIQNDSTYFHQQKKPRINNPTYISSGMSNSLVNLNPPNDYTKTLHKQTEYKNNFEGSTAVSENLSYVRPSIYAKYSKMAFEKNRSMMSNYGATILRESNMANRMPETRK